MSNLKLGIYQGEPVQGDTLATLQLMEEIACEASQKQVHLLIFPELFITGYLPELWESTPTREDEIRWLNYLRQVAKERNLWLIFGHPSYRIPPQAILEDAGGPASRVLTNAVSLVSPKGVEGTYAKVHLFGDEAKTFAPGSEFPVWSTPFGNIAMQICYDIEFPEAARVAALKGAEVLINPANNMVPFGEHHRCYTLARALENGMFVINVNRTGRERDIDFCGMSCIAHPAGKWLLRTDGEEGLFTAELNLSERADLSPAVQYLKQRRPETYQIVVRPIEER